MKNLKQKLITAAAVSLYLGFWLAMGWAMSGLLTQDQADLPMTDYHYHLRQQ